MIIKCIIVEDEPIAAEIMAEFVSHVAELQCLGIFSDAEKAYDYLKNHPPVDVLFLDIQMPSMTGMELLKVLKYKPKIIFTTAHRDYAMQAYELQVADFLLKPIAFDRFLASVNKLMQPIFKAQQTLQQSTQNQEFYFFSVGRRSVKIFLDEILYLESMNDAVFVRTQTASYETKYPLSDLEKLLPTDRFLRIHRSYIVQVKKASSFTANDVTIANRPLPVGRSYKAAAMSVLEGLNQEQPPAL
jgi:DNA-binding LytR/AlgR family response regulator